MRISVHHRPEESFLEAFKKYQDEVFRHCYSRVGNRKQAVELTAQSFEKAWQYVAEGNDIEDVQAFLYVLATTSDSRAIDLRSEEVFQQDYRSQGISSELLPT